MIRRGFRFTNASTRAIATALLTLCMTHGMAAHAAHQNTRGGAAACVERHDTLYNKGGPDSLSKVLGDWEGESVCVDKNRPACKNEHVVYHITKKEGETNAVTLRADKIVNGKPEDMGTLDCEYDASKSTLRCEFKVNTTHGVFEFMINGDEMEGTLKILPAGTLGRKINLKKRSDAPRAN